MRFVRLIVFFLLSVSAVAGSQPVQRKIVVLGSQSWTPVTPLASGTLALWVKADALNLSNGAAVASWTDSTLNANTASQATSSKRPGFFANIVNGKPVVRFDGVDDVLTIPDAPSLNPATITIFAVAYFYPTGADNSDKAIIQKPFTSNIDPYYQYSLGNTKNPYPGTSNSARIAWSGISANGTYVAAGTTDTVAINATWTIFEMSYDGSQLVTIRNGKIISAVAASGALNSYSTPVSIGKYGNTPVYANCDVAEILIYSGLSTSDRQQVERYLGAKYGIALQ